MWSICPFFESRMKTLPLTAAINHFPSGLNSIELTRPVIPTGSNNSAFCPQAADATPTQKVNSQIIFISSIDFITGQTTIAAPSIITFSKVNSKAESFIVLWRQGGVIFFEVFFPNLITAEKWSVHTAVSNDEDIQNCLK
jgi:hypothetical protein